MWPLVWAVLVRLFSLADMGGDRDPILGNWELRKGGFLSHASWGLGVERVSYIASILISRRRLKGFIKR